MQADYVPVRFRHRNRMLLYSLFKRDTELSSDRVTGLQPTLDVGSCALSHRISERVFRPRNYLRPKSVVIELVILMLIMPIG